jgi:hypothetical protein
MAPSLTGASAPVDDRRTLAAVLVAVLADEALVVWSPRLTEPFLASPLAGVLRALVVALVVVALPLAWAKLRRPPRAGAALAWLVLVAERAAASATGFPWFPGRYDAAREALVARASSLAGSVPVGGLVAFALAVGLSWVALEATRANFPRLFSKICVALTLLFATGLTLVYASGAGEAWLEPSLARTSASCPSP